MKMPALRIEAVILLQSAAEQKIKAESLTRRETPKESHSTFVI
ncbi:hypothetical protein SAMN04487935_2891 [Flavobacterium noncentrifugens]|uniref:Uncharacterized protein n=1 Tax=Flavobacterium noncentrifugens TaxID=1128970 RepID=A0A1G9AGY7_9FLAO|nr:hypothetical protein SAMN04487935_2891 [Flavobacterium noncentrifugens]